MDTAYERERERETPSPFQVEKARYDDYEKSRFVSQGMKVIGFVRTNENAFLASRLKLTG